MCISLNFVCDGETNCTNHEDEDSQCKNTDVCSVDGVMFDYQNCQDNCLLKDNCICTDSYFQCLSGGCIRVNQFCVKKDNCKDKFDEFDCIFQACKVSKFTCDNMECLPLSWYCNTFLDCSDGSDEINCTSYNLHNTIGRSSNNNMSQLIQCGDDNPDFVAA